MPLIQDSEGDWYYAPDESDTPQSGTEGLPTDQDSSNLTDYLSSISKPNPLPSHETYVPTTGQKVASAIAGGGLTGGQSLLGDIASGIKSGVTLPADVMAGKVATPVTPNTGPQSSDVEPQDDLLKRVQDMAALMGTGGLVEAPEAASLGSSMIRKSADVPAANAPVFYSAVENAVNNASMKAAPAQQWLSTIQNAKGVKPEELEWTGLKDYLGEAGNNPVTKEQVQGYLQANKTQLTDVDKGITNVNFDQDEIERVARAIGNDEGIEDPSVEQMEVFESRAVEELKQHYKIQGDPTKYSKYQLPGGENYREKLLTLPHQQQYDVRNIEGKYRLWDNKANDFVRTADGKVRTGYNTQAEGNIAAHGLNGTSGTNPMGNYLSSHWDEPNILAHVRMNDRTIEGQGFGVRNRKSGNTSEAFATREEAQKYFDDLPEAMKKNIDIVDDLKATHKSLHLEEVQSDWHQQGREKGYKLSDKQKSDLETIDQKLMNGLEEKDIGNPDINQVLQSATDKKVITPQEASKYKEYSKGENSNIPDAPFKKTWLDLALKRIIREAAEKGYDRLSWTPGEAQALRYPDELRKTINSIEWHNKSMGKVDPSGSKSILVSPKNDTEMNFKIDNKGIVTEGPAKAKGEHISDVIGKDMSNNILNNDEGHIDAKDFVMGAEGMKYFYDKMLPATLKKITGQETKEAQVVTKPSRPGALKGDIPTNAETAPIKYIDLPQSVKDTALHKGFPLFSSGIMLNPVENIKGLTPIKHNPFSKGDTNNDQINNTNDVPYLAGASNTPSGLPVNIDRRMPRYDDKLRLPNGQPADLYKYLSTHELTEYPLMKQGMKYEDAHKIATAAERKAVEADGLNWGEYEHVMDGYLKEIEHEKPSKIAPGLYRKPYAHDKSELDVK